MCVVLCKKHNTAVNCLVSDNGKKSVPFSNDTTFNTLCRIGFCTAKNLSPKTAFVLYYRFQLYKCLSHENVPIVLWIFR